MISSLQILTVYRSVVTALFLLYWKQTFWRNSKIIFTKKVHGVQSTVVFLCCCRCCGYAWMQMSSMVKVWGCHNREKYFFKGALSFFLKMRHNLLFKVESICFPSRKQPYNILTKVWFLPGAFSKNPSKALKQFSNPIPMGTGWNQPSHCISCDNTQ